MTDVVLILSTVPDDERAELLARTLVDEQLAACVNLYQPMVSVYRWSGQVERAAERQRHQDDTRPRFRARSAAQGAALIRTSGVSRLTGHRWERRILGLGTTRFEGFEGFKGLAAPLSELMLTQDRIFQM